MTGQLDVRLETGDIGELEPGVLTQLVGNIYATTSGGESRRQVRIPLGWNAEPASFELPAGRYVVEASLPSGKLFSQEVDVGENSTTRLTMEVTESPYESHTLQFVMGNIEPGQVYHRGGNYPVPKSLGSRSFESLQAPGTGDSVAPAASPQVLVLPRGRPGSPGIEELVRLRGIAPAEASAGLRALLQLEGPPVPLAATSGMPLSPLYRLDDATTGPLYASSGFRHRYQLLEVTAFGDTYLVTAPWPWPDERGRISPVEILLNLRQSPTGSAVSVAVRDPAVGAGLGYLAAGALDKAGVVFADVESMLYGKVRNPLAAAAGAYVLVGTESTGREQRWDRWLGNLRQGFPELSDGAILWAARHLRITDQQGDLTVAREALLEGYHRGLPAYTLGLTWLLDGLSVFPDDPDCQVALQQVRQLSWQIDMREPFVVLRLGRPR